MINHYTIPEKKEERYLIEFIKMILPYRWSIFLTILLSVMIMALYLYFKPYVYESYAIIKIKADSMNSRYLDRVDPLSSALATSGHREVEQELAILQTFYTNNKAINGINLKVQYFIKDNYRKKEIFTNPPIEINDIEIYDNKIIGKYILLHPTSEGFKIQIEDTISREIFSYGKEIKTNKFKFRVEKRANLSAPLYFILNGSNRNIYEKIVKKQLNVSKLNSEVSLIKVAYQDTSAERADIYVNALIDIYIAQSIVDKSKKNNKILDFIEKQLISTGKKLKHSESQLESYRIDNNLIAPTVQSEALLTRLSDIEVQLSENKIEEKLIENLIEFVRHNRNLNSITPTLRELEDEPTIRLIENTQELQRRASELSTEYTEKFPELVSIRRDIRRNKQTILSNINNLKTNISYKHTNLMELKKENEKSLRILPTKEKKLIHLQRDYEVNSRMYSYLLEKKSENEMKKVATISDYEIIDRAYTNPRPIKPKPMMLITIAIFIGLILGTILAYIRILMINKIQNIRDIKHLSSLPIYGKIPLFVKKSSKLKVFRSPDSPITKSFRNLRTSLQFVSKGAKGSTILVTSSVSNEGRTTIVANVSSIFQMAGYKSIVIDLDLYQPKLHKYFGIEHKVGMSTYLNGKDTLGNIIFSTAYQNLDIIPAGPLAPNAAELILSEKLKSLLSTLRKRYDYVFIDSPPFTSVADTLYLMQYSDINLIVLRENFTKKSSLTGLDELMNQHQFKNCGLLLNAHTDEENNSEYRYGQ